MLIFVLLLQLLQLTFGSEELSPECENLFKRNNPETCCSAPFFMESDEVYDECSKNCKNNSDKCCYNDCKYESSGVYVDGNFSKENYLKDFDVYFKYEKSTDARDKWMPVIEESLKSCEDILSSPCESSTCKVPSSIEWLHLCMRQENFIACPKQLLKETSECNAVVEFVKESQNCRVERGGKSLMNTQFWTYQSYQQNECTKLFKQNSPVECCTMPDPRLRPEQTTECKARCAGQPVEECCTYECIFEESGIYKNDEFSKAHFLQSFKLYFSIDVNDTDYEEKWMPVIENSTERCIGITKNLTGQKGCDIGKAFIPLFYCIKQFNFINCPFFEATDKCEESRKFVEKIEKCGVWHGEIFVIESRFWTTRGEYDADRNMNVTESPDQ